MGKKYGSYKKECSRFSERNSRRKKKFLINPEVKISNYFSAKKNSQTKGFF